MGILTIPDLKKSITDQYEITKYLQQYGIVFEQWDASIPLRDTDDQETILKAYQNQIQRLMEKNGYKSADVVNIHPAMENLPAIRQKFLSEHTHSDDEVRFFVDGEGLFWFHINENIFNVKCQKGDLISVPAKQKHWFDLAPAYSVKAIRIFTSPEGWVAEYTNSGIDKKYNE